MLISALQNALFKISALMRRRRRISHITAARSSTHACSMMPFGLISSSSALRSATNSSTDSVINTGVAARNLPAAFLVLGDAITVTPLRKVIGTASTHADAQLLRLID